MTTLSLLLGERTIGSLRELVQSYLWPTSYWFVGALVLFDIFLYGLNKLRFLEHFKAYSAGMLIFYFAAYVLLIDKSKWSVEAAGLASPVQCFMLIFFLYLYPGLCHRTNTGSDGQEPTCPGSCGIFAVLCVQGTVCAAARPFAVSVCQPVPRHPVCLDRAGDDTCLGRCLQGAYRRSFPRHGLCCGRGFL